MIPQRAFVSVAGRKSSHTFNAAGHNILNTEKTDKKHVLSNTFKQVIYIKTSTLHLNK